MSATAALVLLGVAVEAARGNGHDLPLETIQLAENRFGALARNPVARIGLLALQAMTVPDLSRHFVARKRWILRCAEDAVARNMQRIVILGAGGDGLGPHLARAHSDITVVEVHTPADAEKRRQHLRILGLMPDNLSIEAQDLCAGRPAALSRAVHERTLVIAEGVLMYLPLRSACRLLGSIVDSRGCHELILSFALPRADGRLAFARARPWAAWWLARKNEPWQWALDASRAIHWVEQREFRVAAVADASACTRPYDSVTLPSPGESLIFARRL